MAATTATVVGLAGVIIPEVSFTGDTVVATAARGILAMERTSGPISPATIHTTRTAATLLVTSRDKATTALARLVVAQHKNTLIAGTILVTMIKVQSLSTKIKTSIEVVHQMHLEAEVIVPRDNRAPDSNVGRFFISNTF